MKLYEKIMLLKWFNKMQNRAKLLLIEQNRVTYEKPYTIDITSDLRGGGVQGQKSWKHDFEITGDPKGPPSGSTIWWGFEAPDSYGYTWGRVPF